MKLNTLEHFIQFVLAQQPNDEIEHASWYDCAIGDYARLANNSRGSYDSLVKDIGDKSPALYTLLNHGNKFVSSLHIYTLSDFSSRDESLVEGSEIALKLFDGDTPKPETNIHNYAQFQNCLRVLFPELVNGQ